VIFDLWFTLITPEDFLNPYVSSAKRIPIALGLDPEQFHTYWEAHSPAQHRDPRPVREYVEDFFLSRLGRTMSDRDRASLDAIWLAQDQALAAPRPDVLAGLRRLAESGFRLGLLSNAHEREIRGWQDSPLAELFNAACFSCHLGSVKPQPESYHAILDRLQVPGSETVFVGDGASGELDGARSAGIRWTVWMRGHYDARILGEEAAHGYRRQADRVVHRIEEIEGVIRGLST
jgi:putative hydrolase of the HAD superfamily